MFIFSFISAGAPAKPGTFQCRGFGCGLGPESFEKKILARSIKKVHFRPRSRHLKNFAPSLGSDPNHPKTFPGSAPDPGTPKFLPSVLVPTPGTSKIHMRCCRPKLTTPTHTCSRTLAKEVDTQRMYYTATVRARPVIPYVSLASRLCKLLTF